MYINPIALRKANIVHNFGLSECIWVRSLVENLSDNMRNKQFGRASNISKNIMSYDLYMEMNDLYFESPSLEF